MKELNKFIISVKEGTTVQFFNKFFSNFMNIKPIQRQSLLALGSLIAVTGFGYISTFYFAHFLGPAVLGSFFLFLAYYGIFDLIGDGGFGGAAVKRISEGKSQNEYYSAYIILRLILLCLSIVILILISPLLSGIQENGLLFWLIIALIVGTVYSIIGANLYGTAQVGILQVSNLVNTIIKNLVQILAVFIGLGLGGLIAGFITGMIAAVVLNAKYIRLTLSKFNRSHFDGLLSFSIWTFLSSGGALIFIYADTILIGYFMTEADIGIYRVTFQLASIASFMAIVFHTVLYPRISKWHAENNIMMIEKALTRSFTYSLFLAIPIIAGGILLSDKLLYYLYGASFESGAPVLVILLFVQLANIFLYLQTMCLVAMDRPRTSFYITAISAVLNILLNIVLIPSMGILGAAIASLATMSMNAVLAYFMLKSSLNIEIELRSVMNLMVSALGMAVFLMGYIYIFPIQSFVGLGLAIGIGAILYFLVILKIDRSIWSDLKVLLETMNLPLLL
jgi:O-antigen/teichoic acid export membrane protein